MGAHKNRAKLRRRAEDQLEPAAPLPGAAAAAAAVHLQLIHELQVHQLELEMQCRELEGQNKQLRQAQMAELELANKKLAFEYKEITRLKECLLQAQKLESLGLLASGVAHDINNVLGAILRWSSAMQSNQAADSHDCSDCPVRSAFATISDAAIRGGKLVKSLLIFASNAHKETSVINLNNIINDDVNILAHTTFSKVHFTLNIDPELRPIYGDGPALTHAIMNLCVNAVDAMPEQGDLTIRTRNIDNEWVEVLVEDTGSGMSKEVLERALDPFFTTKEVGKGTGLGLSLVYQTVMSHGGQLDIQSEPNNGTRVGIRLPAFKFPAMLVESSAPQPKSSHRALSVLLVDDDSLIQSAIHAMLRIGGHGVDVASSGEEALAKLETGFRPDVVILDMNMPGLGGRGTLPRLRALCPTLPVILSTGRIDQTVIDLAKTHSLVSLMAKPFRMGELQEKLIVLTGGRPGRTPSTGM
jgi:two-component system cell cycle sensor histidine kinase/response regulator CckA